MSVGRTQSSPCPESVDEDLVVAPCEILVQLPLRNPCVVIVRQRVIELHLGEATPVVCEEVVCPYPSEGFVARVFFLGNRQLSQRLDLWHGSIVLDLPLPAREVDEHVLLGPHEGSPEEYLCRGELPLVCELVPQDKVRAILRRVVE